MTWNPPPGSGGSGTVKKVTSANASVTVTTPTGPTVGVEVATKLELTSLGVGVAAPAAGHITAPYLNGDYITAGVVVHTPAIATSTASTNAVHGLQIDTATTLRSGTGVPAIAGTEGDLFIRTTAPTVTGEQIYVCTATGAAGVATWTAATAAAPAGLPVTAETSATGVALINGTQTILTATVPNDGKVHSAMGGLTKDVTTALTGGSVTATWTMATGTAKTVTLGGTTVGITGFTFAARACTLKPGTTFTVKQTTAMTAGAAKVFAKIVII